MAEITPPGVLENASNRARQQRLLSTALYSPGVWSSTDLAVTTPSGLNLSIAAGGAYVSLGTGQGLAACYNDAAVSKTVAAGGAANRIDLVVAQVTDTFLGDGTNAWAINVVDGTSVAPAQPATPARSLLLATVGVNASASTITSVTSQRSVVTFNGGLGATSPLTVTPQVTLNGGLVVASNANNTVPRTPGVTNRAIQGARVTGLSISASATTSGSVTFGTAFATTPAVTCVLESNQAVPLIVYTQTLSTTGFSWKAYTFDGRTGTFSFALHWLAMG